MTMLRRLEVVFGIAAGLAWAWRVQHLATTPIYCYDASYDASGVAPGCGTLFDASGSYVLTLVVLASVVFLAGVASAILHSVTGRRLWRATLWLAAVLLLTFSLLGILTLGWETLPGAALLALAAVCSFGPRERIADGRA